MGVLLLLLLMPVLLLGGKGRGAAGGRRKPSEGGWLEMGEGEVAVPFTSEQDDYGQRATGKRETNVG